MDANTEVSVVLTAVEWNTLVQVLADGPYRAVASPIQKIIGALNAPPPVPKKVSKKAPKEAQE